MNRILLSVFAACLLASTAVFALTLDEAKSSGQVKEMPNGYLSAIASSAEVKTLVNDINAKRRAEYERIAQKNGQPVGVVEKLMGEKLTR